MRPTWAAFYLGLFCLTLVVQESRALSCDAGWFGSNCQFKCHCSGNCDSNGNCLSASCARGWFGPKCQYVDLIASKSSNPPAWLYNNNCYRGSGAFVVTFAEKIPFTWLRIRFDDEDAFQNIQAAFSNNNNPVSCNQKRLSADTLVKDIYCDPQVIVDKVTLSGTGVYYMCAVFISGGRNVALKQVTSQSSNYSGDDISRVQSSNAVDGNPESDYSKNSCTHTAPSNPNPTWSVMFSKPQMVNRYVMYNRNENSERLKGFHLTSYDASQTQVFLHIDSQASAFPVYNIIVTSADKTSPISSVTVTGYHYQNILTICEFEAYGDCEPPYYGIDCANTCDQGCAACSVNGQCQCPAGMMGPNCRQTCPNGNCEDNQCDQTTGYCDVCAEGYWGSQYCLQPCSSHCSTSRCARADGSCSPCDVGYTGNKCDQPCSDGCSPQGCNQDTGNCFSCNTGFWDSKCDKYCSDHCTTTACTQSNGFCSSCDAGWTGNTCEQRCSSGCGGSVGACDQDTGKCNTCIYQNWGDKCLNDCRYCAGACAQNNGKCFACANGKWGYKCEHDCSDHCTTAYCALSDGRCTPCKAGWKGEKCDQPCNAFCAGGCGQTSGDCTSCVKGRYGNKCQFVCSQKCAIGECQKDSGNCSPCNSGYWGGKCVTECSNQCANSNCSQDNGHCFSCNAGYMGDTCNQACPFNKYGANCASTCSSECKDGTCDRFSGYCGGCPAGKMGQFCDQACPPAKHGAGCLLNCSTNCVKNECDGVTGNCIDCPDGKILRGLCDEDCSPGKYGKHCGESCSEFCNMNGTTAGDRPCDHIYGYCLGGCLTGYEEPRCITLAASSDTKDDDSSLVIGLVVGIAILVIVVIVGAVLAVYCYRRSKHQNTQASRQGGRPGYDDVDLQNQDEHGYHVLYKSVDDYDLPRNESSTDNDVVGNTPASGPGHFADYVNADVGHYEEIGEVAPKENPEMNVETEQCEESRTTRGVGKSEYENC